MWEADLEPVTVPWGWWTLTETRDARRGQAGCEGYEMVWIEPRDFEMGSADGDADAAADEKPRHTVQISQGFWLGRTEVTQALWVEVMKTAPWDAEDKRAYKRASLVSPQYPAIHVSWCDAVLFANALSQREGLAPAYELRDGEKGSRYAGTNDRAQLHRYSNIADPAARARFGWDWEAAPREDGHLTLAPVGSFLRNGGRLEDMTGNVWEWTYDAYKSQAYSQSAPIDPVFHGGGPRVMRGGSWFYQPRNARAAGRVGRSPGVRYLDLGFRLAQTVSLRGSSIQ